jgi:S1 RNA binding domain protein
MPLEVGSVVEGKVISITKFGAFVQLPDGNTGLVHISEVADQYVTNVSDFLKENQVVKVKVILIDEKGKYSLSIKKAGAGKTNLGSIKAPPENIDWSENSENLSFEERLVKFKKDSEEKLSMLKKNFESKRGSGGYRKFVQY